jgi:hypothetical protein
MYNTFSHAVQLVEIIQEISLAVYKASSALVNKIYIYALTAH